MSRNATRSPKLIMTRRRRVTPGPAWGPIDPERLGECEAAKERAECRMAEFERAAERVGYARARLTETELRSGPLLTDGWRLAPRMEGVGRRLGSLNVAEIEAEE